MILSLSLKRSRSRVTSSLLLLLLSPTSSSHPSLLLSALRHHLPPSSCKKNNNTWFATHWPALRRHLLKHLSAWPLLLAAHGRRDVGKRWSSSPNGAAALTHSLLPPSSPHSSLLTPQREEFPHRWTFKM
ncbi:hypothetical protein EYF80_066395 [Liparis tanakae]|uniref:Secreted protein n=1 Tax=Liparis tanakae TaxID=230148 RepID=A0A4Z2E4E6_9TELE|nr:hypothetical protein EYF80_066395 [Liparis tanakae]